MKDRGELICVCMEVRRGKIEEVIKTGDVETMEEIGDETEAGTNCGACHNDLEEILDYTRNGG